MNAWLFIKYVSCTVQKSTTTHLKVSNLPARVQESYEKLE